MRCKLSLLCMAFLGTSLALAQAPLVKNADVGGNGTEAMSAVDARLTATAKTDGQVSFARTDEDAYSPVPLGEIPAYPAERRAGSDCGASYIVGQNWDGGLQNTWYYDDMDFCSGTLCQRVTSENFPPPAEPTLTIPVGVVSWHGSYIDASSNRCTKTPVANAFDIKFWSSVDINFCPNTLNSPVCSFTNVVPVSAVKVGTVNWTGGGQSDEFEFTAVLPSSCTIASGTFTVVSSLRSPLTTCFHLIKPSTEGDTRFCRWWTLPTYTKTPITNDNIGYCFAENKAGVCCNDCTGICDPNSNQFACNLAGGRFAQAPATCQSLNPPCGQITGACCKDDGTCEVITCGACIVPPGCPGDCNCDGVVNFADINPFVAALTNPANCCHFRNCDVNNDGVINFADINPFVATLSPGGPCPGARAQGNQWLGPASSCTQCCTVVVPAGSLLEGEPNDCASPDTFNGGCNYTPAQHLSPIACGQTIYGESGTFAGGYRDTDWYVASTSGNNVLTVTVRAEFDVNVLVMHSGTCDPNSQDGYFILNSAAGLKCTDVVVTTQCMPGGTYWFVVTPQSFSGVPCGADYSIALACTPGCTQCSTPCPGGVVHNEIETCGGDTNGGCNITPNAFEPLPDNFTGTICGTTWAWNGVRDTDWYSLKLLAQSNVRWDVLAEVPIRATLMFGVSGSNQIPPTCATAYYWTAAVFPTPCTPGSFANQTYQGDAVNPYYFFVGPEDSTGAIFEGYPCFFTEHRYNVTITTTPLVCPTICIDFGTSFNEGEPTCGAGYVDTFNAGCDGSPADPNKMLTLPSDGSFYCGASGTYRRVPADPNSVVGDIDWWKIVIPGSQRARIELQIVGEIPLQIDLKQGPTCPGTQLETYSTIACTAYTFDSFCYAPGVYWVRVQATGTTSACGKKYVIGYTLINVGCTPCNITCPTPNTPEGETCGSDSNGGCESPTFIFGNVTCGQTICGNAWANGGTSDTDYFQFTLTAPKYVQWISDAEFPEVVWVFDSTLNCSAISGDAAAAGPCAPVTWKVNKDAQGVAQPLPAGTYYLSVWPATISGNTVFQLTANYPCNATPPRNEYYVTLQCSDNPFP